MGLVGPMIVTRKNAADMETAKPTDVDIEFFLMFHVSLQASHLMSFHTLVDARRSQLGSADLHFCRSSVAEHAYVLFYLTLLSYPCPWTAHLGGSGFQLVVPEIP